MKSELLTKMARQFGFEGREGELADELARIVGSRAADNPAQREAPVPALRQAEADAMLRAAADAQSTQYTGQLGEAAVQAAAAQAKGIKRK